MISQQLSWFLSRHIGLIGVLTLTGIAAYALLRRKMRNDIAKHKLKEAIAQDLTEPTSLHPEIDPDLCAGCGACVRACPEGQILEMIDSKAVLVNPTRCLGHGECEASCPFDAISLVFGSRKRGMELPRISTNYETNVKGLYIVGELGGMGLIRNATKQSRLALQHIAGQLKTAVEKVDVDVLIIGAGPAGFAAALAARELKLSYLCIEQGSFGGTITNFPRQKILMTKPVDLPLYGKVQFPRNKSSKQQLLALWQSIRRKARLRIKENTRFESLSQKQDIFEVQTSKGLLRVQKVVLAMGVRGTPRKLGIEGETLAKVTYNLIEPEQYKKRHVAVVGGGNAAVEAAHLLAADKLRNKVYLLVRGKGLSRCNRENEELIRSDEKQGKVKILFETQVTHVDADRIRISSKGEEKELKNSFLFIMVGAEMPTNFLRSLGIKIDKKYGEGLKHA